MKVTFQWRENAVWVKFIPANFLLNLGVMAERQERVQREMEEARRQRETLQLDLESRDNRNTRNEGPEGGFDRREIEMLRQRIGQLTTRIGELHMERWEVDSLVPPPEYSSASER
jgi:hypothetical protein